MGNAFAFIIVGRGGRGGGPARMYLHFVKYPSFFCDTCVKRSRTTFIIASVWRSATWLMWRRPFLCPVRSHLQAGPVGQVVCAVSNELHFTE